MDSNRSYREGKGTESSPDTDIAHSMSVVFWDTWQKQSRQLMQYCLYLLGGDSNEAQEAFSGARVLTFEKFQGRTDIADLAAWIWKITHNVCIDALRNRKRRTSVYERLDVNEEYLPASCLAIFDTPELLVLEEERRMVLEEAIGSLPQDLRLPFIFKYIHQHSFEEIARMFGLSLDTTYKRIQKARDLLREQLSWYQHSGAYAGASLLMTERHQVSTLSSENDLSLDDRHTSLTNSTIFELTATCLETISCQHERYLDLQDWR